MYLPRKDMEKLSGGVKGKTVLIYFSQELKNIIFRRQRLSGTWICGVSVLFLTLASDLD